jgi:hypothetical protein
MVTFNNTVLTEYSIILARMHFIDLNIRCIQNAINGIDKVNDLNSYINNKELSIESLLNGFDDNTSTMLQYAYFIPTGESVALLP